MVRSFVRITAGTEGDLAYAYLRAMQAAGWSVRAIPIGGLVIIEEARWTEQASLFVTPVAAPFVNVVIAPAGTSLGTHRSPLELGRDEDMPAELRSFLGGPAVRPARGTPPLTYHEQTAFSGLLTIGCPNVAILQSRPNPDEAEVRVLARYDRVICPTPADALVLGLLGVKAVYLPPTADFMRRIIEELQPCGSATTATSASSLAMDALREITCSPFTVPAAWSSRSSTSAAPAEGALSVATPTSTSSSSGGATKAGSWFRRMWRSITRRRAT